MLGLAGQRPTTADGQRLRPLASHGVTAMSIGFLVDAEQPMVWRGPMVTQAPPRRPGRPGWGPPASLVAAMPPGPAAIRRTPGRPCPAAEPATWPTPRDTRSP